MTRFVSYLTALCIGLAMPAAASATITAVFADRASFGMAIAGVRVLPLGLAGVPPVLVSNFVAGDLTITAVDAMLAGDGFDILSTEYDGDTMILDFATPIFGIGLFGGVVDVDFIFFDGELLVDVVGSGTTALIAGNGATYLGLLSDVGFTQVRLSIAAFDGDISTVAFVGLQGQVDQATTVPEPGIWALMVGGIMAVGAAQRTRRNLRIVAA